MTRPGPSSAAPGRDAVVVDCLTLWVDNLMYQAERLGGQLTEDDISRRCEEVVAACVDRAGTVCFVTNGVGMGIVPDNAAGLAFLDLAGRCNQVMAAGADKVVLAVCGLTVRVE